VGFGAKPQPLKFKKSKLTLPHITHHDIGALHMRRAVWLSEDQLPTFYLEDAKYFTSLP